MKKFFSLVLALVMALSLTTVAWGAGVAAYNGTNYGTLQEALDDAEATGGTITLLADCGEDVIVEQKAGVVIVIDGANKTYTGTITVDGKSGTIMTAGITIQNVNFDATGISKDACIRLGDGTNATRYVCNLTVTGCTFTGNYPTTEKVAVKSYTGGDKNVTVTGCTATAMHSLVQLKNATGVTVSGCNVTAGKNGISLGASSGATIANCDMELDGYGVRADAIEDGAGAEISDCDIEAFIPVVVRNASEDYNLTFSGTNTMDATNTDGIWCAVGTSEYETNGSLPTASTAEVVVTVNDAGLSSAGVYGKAATVAKVGNTEYTTLAEAVAVGGNVKLLKDVTLSAALTIDKDVTLTADAPVTINTGSVEDAFQVVSGGTLTLGANVTINAAESILYANGGTININGAALKSTHTSHALGFAANGGTINMNSGSVTAYWTGLTASGDGSKVNILGGTVESTNSNATLAKNKGTTTITGGVIKTHGDFVALWAKDSGKLVVDGGAAISPANGAAISVEGATATVSAGTFSGPVKANSTGTIAISGGTFDRAVPAEYCATGMVPVIKNGTFTVGKAPSTSGTTGNNSFSSSTISGVTTSVSAAEKYAIYDAFSTTKVTGWTVKTYTTMATKTVTSNGVTTVSYIPAYYTVTDGTDTVKLYEADANSGTLRIFKGDQFVTYVNPLSDALATGGYVEGDYIADSAAYIAKDKGCGTYGEDVYKINNDKAYAVDPYGRFVAVINGKVAVYDGARASVPHTFTDEVTYKSTTDLTVVAIECDKCEKVFQTVKTTKLPATYKGATVTLTIDGTAYYVLLESAATSGTTGTVGGTDKVVQSAETFDAGIAMYVGMSVMAAAGSVVVLKKRED